MTEFLVDLASYQNGINLSVVKSAGFNKVNVKLSQGNWYVWNNAATYIDQAKSLGFGICTFHWLDNTDTGANQAKIVQGLMKKYGGPVGWAHQCDCEDGTKPATWQIWKDYVNSMQDFLGRHIINYTGDWWWQPHMGTNPGGSIAPYLWAAPNHGYDLDYPGDNSSDWLAGYGGWHDYSILQYAVSPITNAGGGSLSKSAIRYQWVWDELTGGSDMANAAEINSSRNSFATTQMQASYKVFPGDVDGSTEVEVQNQLALAIKSIQDKLGTLTISIDIDALAVKLGSFLVTSPSNSLTQADHDAVVNDLKRALREGIG